MQGNTRKENSFFVVFFCFFSERPKEMKNKGNENQRKMEENKRKQKSMKSKANEIQRKCKETKETKKMQGNKNKKNTI